MRQPPNILTVAGSDSGGGAGIQADLKTIMALGGYGMSVVTALTAQHGEGVLGIHAPDPEFVLLQLQAVREGFPIAAAKTGMLFSAPIIRAVAGALRQRNFPLVVEALKEELLPHCDLLTPNGPEAETLTGLPLSGKEGILAAGEALLRMGPRAVLIKGGHMDTGDTVTDYLFVEKEAPRPLPQPRVDTRNNHGTGCTLSAAIAANLGWGLPLAAAVLRAQAFLNRALRYSYAPGKGRGPVNHAAGCTSCEEA